MPITDTMNALRAFQKNFESGRLPLRKCAIDKDLYVCADKPNDQPRFSYLRLDSKKVTALVQYAFCGHIEETPCFNIGYSVLEDYRGNRQASGTIVSSMEELRMGLLVMGPFYIEAIVGIDNQVSNHIARKFISDTPKKIMDEIANEPAFQYLKKIQ